MIEMRIVNDLHHRMYCAGFGVVGPINQTLDACVHHGSGTHRAWFNCNKEFTASKPVVTKECTCLSQGEYLGMRCRVRISDVAVPSPADDLSSRNNNRADRNLAHLQSSLSTAESFFHPKFVGTSHQSSVFSKTKPKPPLEV